MPRKKARLQENNESSNSIENSENLENNLSVSPFLEIFKQCEDSHAHDRIITELKIEFYEKLNIDEFSEDFFNCFRCILCSEDRSKMEIPLIFTNKFVIHCVNKAETNASKEKSLKLMKRLIKFLTYHQSVQESHVRFNAVRGVKILLNELTDEIDIPDQLYEQIQGALLKRFWDIKSYIRAEAVQAASRLQDPKNADCPIVVALIHVCKFDSCHTVRSAAMQSLAITTKTLPEIVTRCRDVSDLVRKKSYDLLIKWKILKPLTVSKRLQIMESGLTDKSNLVKNSAIELLRVWLHVESDPIALLKRFDVENAEQSTELALKTLLASLSQSEIDKMVEFLVAKMDENRLILEEELNAEVAFFWKHLIQFLANEQKENDERLEKIIPQVVNLESYLKSLFCRSMAETKNGDVNVDECMEYFTIIKHLLPIVKHTDIYDQHNRQLMVDMIKWALSSQDIPFNYVEHLMKLLVTLESNVKICNSTVELINNLLNSENDAVANGTATESCLEDPVPVPVSDPVVVNKDAIRRLRFEIAELDVQINELNESLNNCMKDKMFDHVNQIVDVLKELNEKRGVLVTQNEQLQCPVVTNQMVVDEPELDVDLEMIDPTQSVKREVQENLPWMAKGMEHKIIKACVMTTVMIQECNLLWILPPSLRTLFETVILVSVQHRELCVRERVFQSMGLCCLLDKDLAVQYFNVFIDSIIIDHDSIKEIAVKSLIDMFIRFGIEPFQEAMMARRNVNTKSEINDSSVKQEKSFVSHETAMTEEYNRCTTELMTPIIDLLNSKNTDLLTTVSIGLSKLLYHHKLMSAKLLSRLLLLWFNPITEDNIKFRQSIASFFANFCLMSADNQEAITSCFLITMKALFKAPAKSSLLEIDFNNVIDFFERVTDSKYLIENRQQEADQSKLDNPCHDNLAIILANQILNAPLSAEIKFYVPMLTRLRLSPNNIDQIHVLVSLVSTMIKKIKDKKCLMYLEKFYKSLNKRLEGIPRPDIIDAAGDGGQQMELVDNISIATPESDSKPPSLLEIGSDGKKLNATYLGGRVNQNKQAIMDDTMSQISSIRFDNSSRETIVPSDTDSAMMPPPNMTGEENIFRKAKNVRVTRSSSRLQPSEESSENSSGSATSVSSRLRSQPKKK